MFSTDEAHKLRVYVRTPKGELKKFGKVRATVFAPGAMRVVGYEIKRPDALLMVKRKERFAAIDRVEPVESGIVVIDSADSWDQAACKRLGVDYDACVIWEYMPVKTESGIELGTVGNVVFDETTHAIDHIEISKGATSRTLLGNTNVAAGQIIGYRDGAIVVSDVEEAAEESGGVAAKAGVAWAKTKHAASQGTKKAGRPSTRAPTRLARPLGPCAIRPPMLPKSTRRRRGKPPSVANTRAWTRRQTSSASSWAVHRACSRASRTSSTRPRRATDLPR